MFQFQACTVGECAGIIKEFEDRVILTNGDEIYEGYGRYRGRWLISSFEKAVIARKHISENGGQYFTSWFLKALNKTDAIKEYQDKTGYKIAGV